MALFLTPCPTCGNFTEPQLTLVANVCGISCGSCFSHLRYVNDWEIFALTNFPNIDYINKHIADLMLYDFAKVQSVATSINFRLTNVYRYNQLEYYRLYKYLYDHCTRRSAIR